MDYLIDSSESQEDILKIALDENDKFKIRSNSIASYGGQFTANTTTTRSFWKAIGTSENFPITKIEANTGSVLTIVPPLEGQIKCIEPREEKLKVETLGFLATTSSYDIDLDTSDIYENENLGTVTIEKIGEAEKGVFISGYCGITELKLGDDQRTTVKEDYLLALDDTVEYKKVKATGLKQKALGAEQSNDIKLTGPGKIYMHNRSPFRVKRTLDKLS